MTDSDTVLALLAEANPVPVGAEGMTRPDSPQGTKTGALEPMRPVARPIATASPTTAHGLRRAAVAALVVLVVGAGWLLFSTVDRTLQPAEPLEKTDSAIAAFNAGDLEGYLAMMAPDAGMFGVTAGDDPGAFRDMVSFFMGIGARLDLSCEQTGTAVLLECEGTMTDDITTSMGISPFSGKVWFTVADGAVAPNYHAVMGSMAPELARIATWVHDDHPDLWQDRFTACAGSGNCHGVPAALFRYDADAATAMRGLVEEFMNRDTADPADTDDR